jgi:2-keto-3-deoxygluconate permease
MKLKRGMERVPGGMMMVPLVCGAVITTIAPGAGTFFGSFTNGLFTGSLPILAVFYVCMGASIPAASLPRIARRGGALMLTKISLGVAAGVVLGRLLGVQPISSGWFAGVSTLAIVAALNDTNGGLYMALMTRYGSTAVGDGDDSCGPAHRRRGNCRDSGRYHGRQRGGCADAGCRGQSRIRCRRPAGYRAGGL